MVVQAMGSSGDPNLHLTALQHFEAGQLEEAAALCRRILASAPGDWVALRLLGAVRSSEGAFDEAVRLLAAALNKAPPDREQVITMLNELAEALRGRLDYTAARACYQRALALDPRDARTLHNDGSTLVLLNRHTEALEQYRLALAVTPDSAELRFNEGLTMLALGMWPEAWRSLEARLSVPAMHLADLFPSGVPHWRGETDIRGKTILLHAEQGFGDTIQCVRYARMVAERGARVVLRVQPALGKLLAGLAEAERVLTFYDSVSAVDVQCPLMSLPLVFNTTPDSVPASVPYLHARPEYMLVWRVRLGRPTRKRVGIAWAGGPLPAMRSMPLATLAPLLGRGDIEFHVLQPEMPEGNRAGSTRITTWWTTAARLRTLLIPPRVIAQMDLVITIDTAVAHLAGALGVPVWIMLPFSADGRWLIDRSDTHWYPTARLFRQRQQGDWNGVVADIIRALSE
jgi:Flp pilus assembly protein TadD